MHIDRLLPVRLRPLRCNLENYLQVTTPGVRRVPTLFARSLRQRAMPSRTETRHVQGYSGLAEVFTEGLGECASAHEE